MRVSLHIADDLHAQLKDLAHQEGKPFHQLVDHVLRRGLAATQAAQHCKAQASQGEPRSGIDQEKPDQLAAEHVLRQLQVPATDYQRIAQRICLPASPVGIDAKETHIIIIHKLEQIERRLDALEQLSRSPRT
jgi:hypothetical protein